MKVLHSRASRMLPILFFLSVLIACNDLSAQLTLNNTNTATGNNSVVNSLTGVPAGALLVVACQSEADNGSAAVTSSPSLTWSKRVDAQATHSGNAEIWTAVYSAGGSITITSDFGNDQHSSVCYVITGQESTLGGASAVVTAQSTPSLGITTTRANSIIIGATSDWNAINGSSRIYTGSPTETAYTFVSTKFTTYNYYKSAGASGTAYTFGLSAPTGQSSGTVLYEVRGPSDSQAPSAPTLSSPSQGPYQIDLSWTAATDNVGVTGYDVYLNGNLNGTTTNTTYSVTGLTPSTQYSIYVKAKDAANNSTNSNTITPGTTAASSCVTIFNTNSASGNNSVVNSLTGVPAGALLVVACQSENDFGSAAVVSSPSLTWTKRVDAEASGSGDAEIWTAVYTAGGSISITSDFGNGQHTSVCYVITGQENTLGGASVVATSQTAPSVGITTTRSNSIIIGAVSDWTAKDGASRTYLNSPTETYYYRSASAMTTYNFYKPTTTAGSVTLGLSAPTSQSSGVTLYEIRCPAPPDTIPPTAPTISSPTQTPTTITISISGGSDNVGITGYEIWLNGALIGTTSSTTYVITGLTPSTQYSVYVKAKDDAGNGTNSNTITPTTLAECTRSNVIFTAGFEGSSPFAAPISLAGGQYCCSYSLTQSTDTFRAGGGSFRIDLRKSDPEVSGSKRVEIEVDNSISQPITATRWYGGSWLLPSPWTSDHFGESILQWHDLDGTSPPLAVITYDDSIWVRTNVNFNGHNYAVAAINDIKGNWMDMVLQVKWTTGTDGFIKCWINGTLKLNLSNITTNASTGSYIKIGMNKWNWAHDGDPNNSTVTKRVFFIDEFRIGNENATYEDVAPCTNSTGFRTPIGSQTAAPTGNTDYKYMLGQNFPNPANEQTNISFTLPHAEKVSIVLMDQSGRLVKVLTNKSYGAGTHTISFNVKSFAKNIYYYKIQAGDYSGVKKLIIQ